MAQPALAAVDNVDKGVKPVSDFGELTWPAG